MTRYNEIADAFNAGEISDEEANLLVDDKYPRAEDAEEQFG